MLLAVIFAFAVFLGRKPLVVVTTSPLNGQEGVGTSSIISVEFNRSPSSTEKVGLSFILVPETQTSLSWKGKFLSVQPEVLLNNASYSFSVSYQGRILSELSFKTAVLSDEEVLKQMSEQATSDYEAGQVFQRFLKNYPWYQSLPIENSDYRIVYDFEEKKFRIRLKNPPADENAKNLLVKQALEELKKIGVKEPIQYYILEGE